ncbi:MAG: hypothetical protein AB8B99_04405 [Phormidesmis sp.]
MKLLRRSTKRIPHLPSDEELATFEGALKETADEFLLLRDRFFAIRRAKAKYEQATSADLSRLPAEELAQMQDRIEALKVTLESHLLSWREIQEPFWQIIRFGGLGLIVGWFLNEWLG